MPTVKVRSLQVVFVFAVAALGCGGLFHPVTLPRPISMSPMSDATLSVELGHVFVTGDVLHSGMGEESALAVVLGITNNGREPYTVSAGSMSCWMELSPDLPGETRSFTPAGGGEGDFQDADLDDLKIGSITIPAGATRHTWVVFRGYRFAGKTYGTSQHASFEKGCVSCHMPSVAENQGVGDHSFAPKLAYCKTCHSAATSFDVVSGQTTVKAGLQRLRETLNNLSLLTRDAGPTFGPLDATALADKNFELDLARPKNPVDADTAGALYNYFVLARGSAFGVHNPVYTRQLIFDSIQKLAGDTTGISRP